MPIHPDNFPSDDSRRAYRTSKAFGGARLDNADEWRPAAMLRIDPADNVILGAQNICSYLGVSSITTLWRWIEIFAFPAIKRPDGIWMTTMTSIDQWIFLAAELTNEKLETSRGTNAPAALAAARLARQAADPELFASKRRAAAQRAARGVGLTAGRREPKRPYLGTSNARAERANGSS